MPNIGAPEIIIVLIIALIVFGPKRIPDLGRSLGRGMREFKDSISGDRKNDDHDEIPETSTPAQATPPPPAEPVTTSSSEGQETSAAGKPAS
jgi:sec-independent protein translocase protein TatA